MSDGTQEWKIGELAAAAGLTVRTLHHYDKIGLLSASRRTGGGHRLYTEADAARLYQIVALRGLGLGLDAIRDCLVGLDPRTVLAEQLRALTVQLKAGERLRIRLTTLLEGERLDVGDLVAVVAVTEGMLAGYVDDERLERLRDRYTELGPVADRLVKVELPGLYRQALAEYDAGTDPADPVVTGIVEAIDRVSARLSGGAAGAGAGVRRMWAERGEEIRPNWGIPWAELADYLERARAATRATPESGRTP